MQLKHPRDWTPDDLYADIPHEHRKEVWHSRKQLLEIMWRIYKRTHNIQSGSPEDTFMYRYFNSDDTAYSDVYDQ